MRRCVSDYRRGRAVRQGLALFAAALPVGWAAAAGPVPTSAIAREVSVLNDPKVFSLPQSITAREVGLLNDPKAFSTPNGATAREISLLNDPKAFAAPSSITGREVALLNDPKAFATALSVVAREFTVQVGALPPPGNAQVALTLAGGLAAATPAQKTALNVVTTPPSAATIDIMDAVRLARQAAGLN
jgi:hypothetical protein